MSTMTMSVICHLTVSIANLGFEVCFDKGKKADWLSSGVKNSSFTLIEFCSLSGPELSRPSFRGI